MTRFISALQPAIKVLAICALSSLSLGTFAQQSQEQLPLEDLKTFADVFNHIRLSYVEEVDDKTLLEYAIRGMLSGLDPHSAYLDEESFDDLQVHTSGEFGGLGLEVGMEIDQSPARGVIEQINSGNGRRQQHSYPSPD